jgi:hypothetical protein
MISTHNNVVYYKELKVLEDNYDIKIHKNNIVVRKEELYENKISNSYFHTSIKNLENIIYENKDKCYHECLTSLKKVKIFMDIDDTYSKSIEEHNIIVNATKNEFCAYFNSKCQFLANVNVLTSKDFIHIISHKEDGTKYSTNLIVKGYHFENMANLIPFMLKFKNKLELNDKSFLKYLDFGVYSKNKNIRLQGSSKLGENRPKKSDYSFEEILITNIDPNNVMLTSSFNEDLLDESESDEIQDTTELMKRLLILPDLRNLLITNKTYTFGEIKNRTIFLIRNKPDYCESCRRIHDNDNCMYLVLTKNGNVYIKCKKTKDGGKYLGLIDITGIVDLDTILEEYEYDTELNISQDNYAESIKNLNEQEFKQLLLSEKSPKMRILMRDVYYNKTLFGPDFNTVMDNKNIEYYNNPEIKTFEPLENGINLEKAEMKMGKTKKCHELIYNSPHSDKLKTVIFVSFRRTFSEDIKSKFTDFSLYKDVKGSTISLIEHPRLIIQTESLHRINENTIENVDLLILDELESIWSQFGSGFFHNINGSLSNFERLLKKTKYVFGFDANIGTRSVELLNKIVPNKEIKLRINKYKISREDTYYICPTINNFLNQLSEDIDNNKNIGIFTNSYSDAHALKSFIKELYPFKYVKLYHGKMDEKIKTQHFSNVNKYWKNYDIIIATPVVTAGVSFEEEHFDCVYGLFNNNSCCVNTCRQMLGRIRNVSEKKYYLHFADYAQTFPTDINMIENYILYDRSYFSKLIDSDGGIKNLQINLDISGNVVNYNKTTLYWIVIANIREENISKNRFSKVFLDALGYSGVNKELCLKNNDTTLKDYYSDLKGRNKIAEYKRIAESNDITENEAQEIRQKIDTQLSILKSELWSLTKYNIKKRYDWNKPFDVNFVSIYADRNVQNQYTNIQEIMSDSEPSEACRDNLIKDLNKYKKVINNTAVPYKEIIIKYKSFNHFIIHELICALNPNFNIQDAFLGSSISIDKAEKNFKQFENNNKLDWKFIVNKYGLSIFKYPSTFIEKVKLINSIISKYYGFKLIIIKKISTIRIIPNLLFNYIDQDGINLLDIPTDNEIPTINVKF